jgi:hypothetical protein
MLRFNNKLIRINGNLAGEVIIPPKPPVPSDMDFIYLAKDFDGTKITNKAINSTFGDYLANGTITINGSGSTCYLSNDLSDSNYLYKNLTNDELNKIKAIDTTYTWFIRVYTESNGVGGIFSTRMSGGYVYMIRSNGTQLQIHTSGGYDCGSDFLLNVDRVYKVTINGSSFLAKNLDTNAIYYLDYSTNRNMGNFMTTFNAGYNGESKLDRFYALAGIPRATTAEEDEIIKSVLMNQNL